MSQQEPEGRPRELEHAKPRELEHAKPRELEYAKPEPPKTARLLMGIFGGVFGYLGLLVVTALLYGVFLDRVDLPGWVTAVTLIAVPLGLMVVAAVLLKSRAMMLAVWITFGVVALSCGACAMMVRY